MINKRRKNFPAELKRESVRLVKDEGYKIAEAARSLDISANMLGRWVREVREVSCSGFYGFLKRLQRPDDAQEQ